VGIISLQDARKEAKRLLAEYTLGKHQPLAKTWRDAVEEYLEECEIRLRPSTYESYKRHLNRQFRFGNTRMGQITPHDLHRDLDRLRDRPGEHHHAFCALRAFVRWAYRRHYFDRNPMDRMKAPQAPRPKDRVLTDDEIRKVWHACPDDPFGRIVKLLLLCGQRVGETSKITAGMIGPDTITIPAAITKNKRKHTFPFPEMARPLFHDLTYNGFGKAKARLDKESGVTGWTLHDLRRTFASGLAGQGVPIPVIERLLNHISGTFSGVVGVYQRYDFMPEMRDAVSRWNAHIQALIQVRPSACDRAAA
jgi:integrase